MPTFSKKKLFIILTTLLAVVVIGTASKISYDYYNSTQQQIQSYQEKLTESDSKIHKIEGELSSSKEKVEGLEKEKTDLDNMKNDLEQQKSNLEEEIKQRDAKISELESDKQKLQEKVSSLEKVSYTPIQKKSEEKPKEVKKEEPKKEPAQAPVMQSAPTPQKEESESSGNWMNFVITAYTNHPSENGGTYGGKVLTKSGHDITNTIHHNGQRIIAVDPSVIPLGSTVEIEGYGRFVAIDTGGAIKGNRIDILVGSASEMNSIGKRGAKVRIIK